MKSSSLLFPVALQNAESLPGGLVEDGYLLKPNNSPDLSVKLSLTRIGDSQVSKEKHPIILIHGGYTNSGFWLSGQGEGLAGRLAREGFDPWVLDLRGHGNSPQNNLYLNNDIEAYAKFDLPAVVDFVIEQTGKSPVLAGHSLGGKSIATALVQGSISSTKISGVLLFGAQLSNYPILYRLPVIRFILSVGLSFKKILSSTRGPEVEPVGVAKEYIRWASLFRPWRPKKGPSYWKQITKLPINVMAFGGKNDKKEPAKDCFKLASALSDNLDFRCLSKSEGYSIDYDHVNMLISEEAEKEVWPKIIEWLNCVEIKHVH